MVSMPRSQYRGVPCGAQSIDSICSSFPDEPERGLAVTATFSDLRRIGDDAQCFRRVRETMCGLGRERIFCLDQLFRYEHLLFS